MTAQYVDTETTYFSSCVVIMLYAHIFIIPHNNFVVVLHFVQVFLLSGLKSY